MKTVFEIIKEIERRKDAQNKHPTHVLYLELLKESKGIKNIKSELNALYIKGEIKVGDTLNDKYITTRKE